MWNKVNVTIKILGATLWTVGINIALWVFLDKNTAIKYDISMGSGMVRLLRWNGHLLDLH